MTPRPRVSARLGRAATLAAVSVSLVLLVAAGFLGAAADEKSGVRAPSPAPTKTDSLRFVAYYFHGNMRCATCRKLEQYSQAAIQKGFPQDLATGKLAWSVVNVDKKENAHFVKEFELYTRSLVLVAEREGKVIRWKNLPRIWELTGDQAAFEKYVRTELRGFMAKPS